MDETAALRALTEADRWIDRVGAQRNHLVEKAELDALEGELRQHSTELREAKALQVPVRNRYEEAQRETERLTRRANDLDKTLAASTANARELAAIHKEAEHVRQLLVSGEDNELELLVEVEPLDDAVASIKARAQPGLVRRAELQATITELQKSLDEELVSLRHSREERAAALSAELRSRYESLLKRVGTSGAARVESGRCDGCRILLSPLDVDRWKAQPPGVFMACPECGRLLLP